MIYTSFYFYIYIFFTVNTSSRMESTGEPLKIHISKECNAELTKLGGFVTGTYLKYYSKAKLFQEDCFS